MAGQYADSQKSMEDILSSIRETIEEDMKAGKNWTETPLGKAIASAAPSAEKEEVFELTQMVNEDGSVTDLRQTTVQVNDAFDLAMLRAEKEAAAATGSLQDLDFSHDRPLEEKVEMSAEEQRVSFQENSPLQGEESARFSLEDRQEHPVQKTEDPFALAAMSQEAVSPPLIEEDMSKDVTLASLDVDALFAAAPAREGQETAEVETVDQREFEMPSFEEDQAFLSEEALSASTKALSELAQTVEQKVKTKRSGPAPEGVGAQTLDDIMQDLLRPMLKEWLDARLPSLVKWIVTEQIEKMIQQSQEPQKDN